MNLFNAYMAKYCDAQQHQLNRLSHMREVSWEIYNKAQAKSWVPQLENDLAKARLKLVDLAEERNVLAT